MQNKYWVMKTGIINQMAGLGDILFCQKIATLAKQQYGCNKVIWPVDEVYKYLSEYIESDSTFIYEKSFEFMAGFDIINTDDILYVPLCTSDRVISGDDPRAHGHIKYKFFFDTDYKDWKDYFSIKRNSQREALIRDRLGINPGEQYNFINCNYGTPPNYLANSISPNNGLRNIYMQIYSDVNIFDWLGVIEDAREIHTMETSLYYIIEKMNIENNVFIYSKYKAQYPGYLDDYGYMRDHCSKKWNYV